MPTHRSGSTQLLWRALYETLCALGRPFGGVRPRRIYDLLGRRAYPIPHYQWHRNRWGDELLLSPSFHIDRNILVFGNYDDALHQFIESRVTPGMICMDVGANLGEMALHMARLAGGTGKVYAFEPVPVVFDRLRQHVDRNGYAGIIEPVQIALGDRSGERVMALADENADNQGLASIVNLDRREVPGRAVVSGTTLDEFVKQRGIHRLDLIKVDIQGAELEFLNGGQSTLAELAPELVMEVSPGDMAAFGKNSRDLCGLIESFGYSIRHLSASGKPGQLIRAAEVAPNFAAVNVVCSKRRR